MNILFSMALGAAVGWASLSFLHFNEGRAGITCAFIGAIGGFIGAKFISPMFFAPALAGELLNFPALFCALVIASASLAVGDFVLKRWDV